MSLASSVAAAPDADGAPLPHTVSFSVQARAEPGVMPRLVELFAKRGLIPQNWRSIRSGATLAIDLEIEGLDADLVLYIARSIRQIIGVETVLTSAG